MNQVETLLTDHGFKLVRQRKHKIWKHADGRVWTVGNTPSHNRAMQNNYSDLRNFLERGKVQGTFGLTAIDDSEREAAERKLHPVKRKKAKPVKERNLGIAIERFKPVSPAVIVLPQKAPKARATDIDVYEVGQILRQSLAYFIDYQIEIEEAKFREGLTKQAHEELEDIVREVLATPPPPGCEQISEQEARKAAESYTQDTINRQVAAKTREAKEWSREICTSAARIFQKVAKRMRHERVDAKEVQALLTAKVGSVAEHIFTIGLFSFFPASIMPITNKNGMVQLEAPDGKLLEPSDVWDEHMGKGWGGNVQRVRPRPIAA